MDASRVLVLVAPIKTHAQSLRLALCARPEWVSRLDLATQISTDRTRGPETRAKKVEFCQWRLSGPVLPIPPAIDPFNLAFIKRPPASYLRLPGSGHEATRLSPVPGVHSTTWPIVPRRTPGSHEMWPPPGPRPAPFFWPAVVSSMELPVPFDQNPRLSPAVPVPPSRRCCCPDCDFLCWRCFD